MFFDAIEQYIKGKAYAQEPWRLVRVDAEHALFQGNHNIHLLTKTCQGWGCNCDAYNARVAAGLKPLCAHAQAADHLLNRRPKSRFKLRVHCRRKPRSIHKKPRSFKRHGFYYWPPCRR